jgi:hypothetical protein
MKKFFTKHFLVMSIPALVVFTLPHISLSDGSPLISSYTDIVCSGNVTMNQTYNFPGNGSNTNYSDSITSNGGATTVVIKNFSANAESGNAIESERFLLSIYDPSVLVGALYSEEKVGSSTTSGSNPSASAGSGAAAKGLFTHSEANVNSERNILLYYGSLSEGKGAASYSATAHLSDNNFPTGSEAGYGVLSTMGGMDFSQNLRVGSATIYEKSYFVLGQEFTIGESISSK